MWRSQCTNDDGDAEEEFLQQLLESVFALWRKVPMHTSRLYFGKSATGFHSLQGRQNVPSPHPREGSFASPEKM